MKHANISLNPSDIVCLEHEETRLYAEVIQLSQWRQVAWVRPLVLVPAPTESRKMLGNQASGTDADSDFYDLRQGADLLWPTCLIRRALDTEVMPLLTLLYRPDLPPQDSKTTRQKLNYFVRSVWEACPSAFQASG